MESLSRSQLRSVRRDAEAGDAAAQYNLGVWHLRGDPQGPDPDSARRWLEAAADQGHAGAHCALGYLLLGAGAPGYDPQAARGRFARAAAQGHPDAQFRLGEMCVTGFAGEPDPVQARRWFAKAARMGHAPAQCQLAYLLEHAVGGDADPAAATRWYQEAARLGERRACIALAMRHARGHTVQRDPAAALGWWLRAGDHPVAAAAAATLDAELDEAGRAAARAAVRGAPTAAPVDAARCIERRAARAEVVSWAPRVFVVRGLLDEEERAQLVDLAAAQLAAGAGPAAALGGPLRDAVVWNVERRTGELLFLAPALGDAFRVVRRADAWSALPVARQDAGPPVLLSMLAVLAGERPGGAELASGAGRLRVAAGDALVVFHALADGRPDPAAVCDVPATGGAAQWLALKHVRAALRPRAADALQRTL